MCCQQRSPKCSHRFSRPAGNYTQHTHTQTHTRQFPGSERERSFSWLLLSADGTFCRIFVAQLFAWGRRRRRRVRDCNSRVCTFGRPFLLPQIDLCHKWRNGFQNAGSAFAAGVVCSFQLCVLHHQTSSSKNGHSEKQISTSSCENLLCVEQANNGNLFCARSAAAASTLPLPHLRRKLKSLEQTHSSICT